MKKKAKPAPKNLESQAVRGAERPSGVESITGDAWRGERWWVVALCAVGALRVFFGAAALPIFACTDEYQHFDLVQKLARGYWPDKSTVILDNSTLKTLIYHSTPEYLNEPEESDNGPSFPAPVRDRLADPKTQGYIHYLYERYKRLPNHEAFEPPVYYALAGVWLQLGESLGLTEASSVYWVRFLNVPMYAALVAAAYFLCRPYFGRDLALAASALTAFFPNPIYYLVTNDALSPLAVAAALVFLMRWAESDRPGWKLGVAAGALVATALLVKLSNAAALVAAAAAVLLHFRRAGNSRKAVTEALPLILFAALPLLLWAVRNRLVLGGWTGTDGRLRVRGLEPKPFGEMLDHPLFTVHGLATFLTELCASLFRGEMTWAKKPVEFPPARVFFLVTAALLPVIGLAAILLRGRKEAGERAAAGMCALVVVASVCQLAVMSLLFRFPPDSFPPSREFPYYAFGRLAGGALLPFCALYALGIHALFGRRQILFAAAITVPIVMMVLAQIPLLQLAVSSQYNWFHLPSSAARK